MSAMDGDAKDNVALLQQMLKKRPPAGERCDFCATSLGPEHSHIIELAQRRIMCACRPCFIVFEPEGAAGGKYRPIGTRYREIMASLGITAPTISRWPKRRIGG